MPTKVMVEARVLGRRSQRLETRPLLLDGLPDRLVLSQLIEHVVRAEVKAFRDRKDEQRLVRFLTESEIADASAHGKVSAGGYIDDDHKDTAAKAIDEQNAVDVALLAHLDGLFQVIVNGVPVDDQEQTVAISEGASLMFIRLVALAGG